MRGRYGGYTVQLPRNGWLLLLGGIVAVAAAGIVITLVLALLALAATAAVVLGGAWLAWQITRKAIRPALGTVSRRDAAPTRRSSREVRGLLELAAAPDPMERYLLAVREFERISMAALELDPQTAGSRRTARRAIDLAEQAQNLDDAVTDVERQLVGERCAEGARAHVWELALAVREVEQYLTTLGSVRGRPSLSALRTLVSRRAALTARRSLLVDRLEDAQVTRALGTPRLA